MIVGIEDELGAYQFDAAALALGRAVDQALRDNAAKDKKRRKPAAEVVSALLGVESTPAGAAKAPTPQRTLRPGDPDYDKWARLFGLNTSEAKNGDD